jgi:uncharacterized membrane protein
MLSKFRRLAIHSGLAISMILFITANSSDLKQAVENIASIRKENSAAVEDVSASTKEGCTLSSCQIERARKR